MTIEHGQNIGRISPRELALKYSIPQERNNDFLEIGSLYLNMPRANKAKTMLIGEPDSPIALCTGWDDPEFVVSQENVEQFSIIAPLRSLAGVDIMLWNLVANPHIRCVYFYSKGKLNKTERAMKPKEMVFKLWQNGVDDEGRIKDGDYQLNKALVEDGAIEIIRRVIGQVSLVDLDSLEVSRIETERARFFRLQRYMEGARLPEFRIEETESLPSEEMGFMIRERKVVNAWLRLLDRIVRYGKNTKLETREGTMVREIQFVHVVIEEEERGNFYFPEWLAKVEQLGLTPEELEEYYKQYFRPESYLHEVYPGVWKFIRPPEDKYLYAELMYAFPRPKEIDIAVEFLLERKGLTEVVAFLNDKFPLSDQGKTALIDGVLGDGSLDDRQKAGVLLEIFRPSTNQVANVIERIRNIPDDADKTFILWNPDTHGIQYSGRPCLVEMALLVRGGKINARAVFRSHDIAKGWLKNVYGVYRFLEEVCVVTGYEMGKIEAESESGHFYLGDQDWIKKLWQEQLVGKAPRKVFDEREADPRGDFAIEIIDGKIVCTLLSPRDGKALLEFTGITASEIINQLNHSQPISQVSHGLYIGGELVKAEVSLRLGKPYVQDRSLILRQE